MMTIDPSRRRRVLVCHQATEDVRGVFFSILSGVADIRFLDDAGPDRKAWIADADVLISRLPHSEILNEEWSAVRAALLQVTTSGVNHLHFDRIPAATLVSRTPGVQSEAIAEHALAFALAAAKDLTGFRNRLARKEFDFDMQMKLLCGGTCCVLGLGQVGRAVARLFDAIGMNVHAINTSGATDEPTVSAVGTLDDFVSMISIADVVVITLSLTDETRNLIGADQLSAMRPDAILINVARARIIDQKSLYEHLVAHPSFYACLDAWWEEPFNEGRFHLDFPFFELPNIIGTPHNSSRVPSMAAKIATTAAGNVFEFITTGAARHILADSERRWV